MSVNPRLRRPEIIPYVLDKARAVRKMIDDRGLSENFENDGGVGPANIAEVQGRRRHFVAVRPVFGAAKYSDPQRYNTIIAACAPSLQRLTLGG